MRYDEREPLAVRVQLGDLGPYPGRLWHVIEDLEIRVFDDPRMPERASQLPRWRAEVADVPYGDGNRIAKLSGDLIPVDVVFTCDGWPQRYTAKAWLTDLGYHLGPRLPGMAPLGRREWLSFVLQSVGTVRDLRRLTRDVSGDNLGSPPNEGGPRCC